MSARQRERETLSERKKRARVCQRQTGRAIQVSQQAVAAGAQRERGSEGLLLIVLMHTGGLYGRPGKLFDDLGPRPSSDQERATLVHHLLADGIQRHFGQQLLKPVTCQ